MLMRLMMVHGVACPVRGVVRKLFAVEARYCSCALHVRSKAGTHVQLLLLITDYIYHKQTVYLKPELLGYSALRL